MPAASLVNTVVGACYRLTRQLGEGGMGTVYEAQHLRLGGTVAVKILAPQYAADSKFRDRFKREARAASQIHHPNVVQITDFGETPSGSVFFTMEMLEGHDLHHILHKHAPTPFPIARALHLLAQAADALAAAHRVGIIHRDVKPSNIFVLESAGVSDFVKLLDFGIAKIVAPTPTADSALVKNLTGTGEIFGTAKYMPPEQAYGGSNDPRMDVYSLGVVAYELLTGRVPFTGQSSFEIITRHVYDSPRPLRELRPDLPAALEAVVLRAMEKKPENRFATMEEFGKALRQAGSAIPSARAHADTNTATMPRGRHKDLLAMHGPAAQQAAPAVVPAPVASVVRKTIPVIAAAPSPAQAAGPAVYAPAAHSPVPPFGGQPPVAAPFVAAPPVAAPFVAAPPVAAPFVAPPHAAPAPVPHRPAAPAPPPAPSPTDNVARMQPPTGPLARRGGAAYDDTSRERAMRHAASGGQGRTVAFVLLGAVAIASVSAIAAVFVLKSSEGQVASMEASTPTADPPARELQPPPDPEPAAPPPAPAPSTVAPTPDAPAPTDASGTDVASDEVVAPPSAIDVTPSPVARPLPSRSPSTKPRPRPTAPPVDPDPDDEITKRIGSEIRKQIRHDCWKLGEGKKYYIRLQVGGDGRVIDKTIAAVGSLRACIEKTIGTPQFPAKKQPVELTLTIGECVEAFGSTVSKCK